jgi:PAS domain S-box-containing protein
MGDIASVFNALTSELLFESSTDCVKLMDAETRLLRMNRAGQCLMEIDDFQKFVGRAWAELWPEPARDVLRHEVDRARGGGTGHFSAHCPTAKGAPKFWDVRITPVHRENGELAGLLSVSRDTTSQLRGSLQADAAQPQRHHVWGDGGSDLIWDDSEGTFRVIANAMPQIVWSSLPRGYHDYYNDQWYEFTGVVPGSTDGEGWTELLHPDDRWRVSQAWTFSVATGQPYAIEYRLRHRSGEFRWTLDRALPIRDTSGKIVRWMGTCTDIHELRQAQDELRDSDRRKDEFLAMLAHELRNPLAPISAAAEVLRISKSEADRVQKMSDVIFRQAGYMTEMIDDLLDVSRVTRGRITLSIAPVEVHAIVAQAVEQVRPLVDAHAHQLDVTVPPEGIRISGDKKRLVQVLVNVLHNAVKYTPNGGRIQLRVGRDGDRVFLSVRDNGVGMSAELAERAFELFVQGERSADRSQGGLGIGLALVRSLVSLHRGQVTAHSEGVGQGSEFTIWLPAIPEEQPLRAPTTDPALEAGRRGLRVLVVDDNIDAAQILALLLECAGHVVHVVHHPLDAIDCVEGFAPHVCLLDIGLPEMSGNELARRLRTLPALARTKLIAVTGYGQPQDREACLAAGFDHHFVKPVDGMKLLEMLSLISADPAGEQVLSRS